jgi:RNA polymerase-binding transcription factor DksA
VELEGIEQRLREKERELSLNIARLEVEARAAGDAGVQDATDNAASSRSASESLLEGSRASQTLTQVQDALRRIEAATYGKCIDADARSNQRDCTQSHGRPIAWRTRRSRTRRRTCSKVVRPFDRLTARGPARWSTSFAVNTAWEGLRDPLL